MYYNIILEHSAKGTTWKDHKYIKKEGDRYIYDTKSEDSKRSKEERRASMNNVALEKVNNEIKDEEGGIEWAMQQIHYLDTKIPEISPEESDRLKKTDPEYSRNLASMLSLQNYVNDATKKIQQLKVTKKMLETSQSSRKESEYKSERNKKMKSNKVSTSSARKESELEQIGRSTIRSIFNEIEKISNR